MKHLKTTTQSRPAYAQIQCSLCVKLGMAQGATEDEARDACEARGKCSIRIVPL